MIKELKELWTDAPVSRRIGAIAMSLVVLIVGIWAVNINWLDQNTTGPGTSVPGYHLPCEESMNKSYVIMAPYWDYNDEYSYTVGEGAGSPVASFTNREAADKRCEELEIEAWRLNLSGESIGAWMWDSYKDMSALPEDEAQEKLKAAFPDEDGEDVEIDLDDFVVPSDVTDEQIAVLREVFSWIYFNHVVEVDLE